MITLMTGLPGAGKTLRAITLAMEQVAQGREVYELGVNGMNHAASGIKPAPFDDLEQWRSLPTGSVLLVDEVQRWLKPRGAGAAVPDWIEAFTRNRHYGVDLWFVTQDPLLIDAYPRRLVNYHHHVVRLEGNYERARVYRKEGIMPLKDGIPPASASFELWPYPQQNYALYKSAEEHTVKRYLPQRIQLAIAGLLFCLVMIGVAWWAIGGLFKEKPEEQQEGKAEVKPEPLTQPPQLVAAPSAATLSVGGGSGQKGWTTAIEYVEAHTPVIEGQPWTAPVYSGMQPTSIPEIYCISSEKSCTCVSEQGTRLIVREAVCRTIAREGSYNPYRRRGSESRSGVEVAQQRRGTMR